MEEFLTEAHQRKDLHYHVTVGEADWMPEEFGHPDNIDINIIYKDKDAAYSSFISRIRGLGAVVTPKDIKASLLLWEEACEEVKDQHALEVITFLGIAYRDLGIPIELIACNSCVPYGMN